VRDFGVNRFSVMSAARTCQREIVCGLEAEPCFCRDAETLVQPYRHIQIDRIPDSDCVVNLLPRYTQPGGSFRV